MSINELENTIIYEYLKGKVKEEIATHGLYFESETDFKRFYNENLQLVEIGGAIYSLSMGYITLLVLSLESVFSFFQEIGEAIKDLDIESIDFIIAQKEIFALNGEGVLFVFNLPF